MKLAKLYHWGAILTLIALIFLCLSWELWLAPLHAGGSWLVFKALLLLIPLFGILRGRIYTYQWTSMFILIYFTEGIMRGWSEHGLVRQLSIAELLLSVGYFVCVVLYVRQIRLDNAA